jgi:predicted RND superfamily exporter protein
MRGAFHDFLATPQDRIVLRALAALLVRKPVAWATVVIVVAATLLLAARAVRVERDDDLLAFLPKSNPDIQVFNDVAKRFGSLDVALIGVAADDAVSPEFLAKLRRATKQLNETKGVDYALSLANVEDFTADPEKGGIGVDYLIPKDVAPAAAAALREKVMSRDQVVSNLVSADGKAAMIYCFLSYGVDPKASAASARAVVEQSFPPGGGNALYFGGAPFIQSYIFGVTQEDLRRLTPWACAVILIISIWAFRDAIGTALALFTTVAGIVTALGLMATFGVKTNLVLGSMPVILFALGSAYPIHILTRYYAVVKEMGRDRAIVHAITYLGPTVIASGLITAGGLLSFVAMDMEPIRTFGFFTAVGVLTTLILSVTFVPAVIRVFDLKARLSLHNPTSRTMVRFCTEMATRRLRWGIVLGLLSLAGALFVGRIDSRIDNASFYARTSPPALAEAFLREHFGGSQFFQIHVEGDMNDPDVLREVRALADRLAVLPHVSSVNHVGVFIGKVNEAMEGDERIPDTAAQVEQLYGFLAGKRAVDQVVTQDRAHTLLHVKVDTDRAAELEEVQADIERAVAEVPTKFAVAAVAGNAEAGRHQRALVVERLRAIGAQLGAPVSKEQADAVAHQLEHRAAAGAAAIDRAPIEAAVLAFLQSEEFPGDLPKTPADAPRRVAAALVKLGPHPAKDALTAALATALDRPGDDAAVLDLAAMLKKRIVERPVADILRRQAALAGARRLVADAKLAVPPGGKGDRFLTAAGAALMDLDLDHAVAVDPAGPGKLAVTVTGMPVLNRGLSRSVDQNQIKSFFMAMGLVLLIVLVLYKSITSALLAMAPVSITLLVVYGGMGLLGVHLDIGTSMLASLTTGAGVDYAVHLLAAWKGPPGEGPARPEELNRAASYAAFLVGRAIWTNALMVAGGFVVLTMGEARPLQNVGGLTAAAMIVAALATFAAIPVLARKRAYDTRPRIAEILPASDAALGDAAPDPSMIRGSS